MFHRDSQSLPHHLWSRESNYKEPGRRHPRPQRFHFYDRNFYKSITPCLSVQNVQKPFCYLRKFTPDGRYLLAFSSDQRSLESYEYQGVADASKLLERQRAECIWSSDPSVESLTIRQNIFEVLFKRVLSLMLIQILRTSRHVLNREFSLFLEDGRYVLVASVAGGSIFPNYLAYQDYPDLYDDTELYDYTFYLVDLHEGCVTDSLLMEHDFIVLSHNHSVSVYDNTVAVLSTYRQCIDLFEVDSHGKFQRMYTVGPYGNDVDRDRVLDHIRLCDDTLDHNHGVPLSHLKQKIITFLYREALEEPVYRLRKEKIDEFYRNFTMMEHMILMKMQLIDSDHMFIRYEKRLSHMPAETYVVGGQERYTRNLKLYVFYNATQQKILKIYEQNSTALLEMMRDYCDDFRNVRSLRMPWHASSPSNNEFFKASFDAGLRIFPGGILEAAERYNPTMPISSQSFSTSPYLDYSLYNYDDKFISTLERPRMRTNNPIPFYDRNTGQLKFCVQLEPREERKDGNSNRDLVTFIIHPFEPFFISIQRSLTTYVINFHIYNVNIKVRR